MAWPLQLPSCVRKGLSTMAQANAQETGTKSTALERDKALKILAKSIFKELKGQGYESKNIVGLATELISLVTNELGNQPTSDTQR